MTINRSHLRPTAAGVALLAAVTLGACGSDGDSVQNDPVDDSSETTPGEDENQDAPDY
ncbi:MULTISPECIES: hypothetical protein [Nocardioides]|uniref:Uncharacterized protein n=1 Tax=Nocardioides vastitatis TaxID=2568655 RepID=A0ABW0ZD09_9ACTN|nr:hypothetical protein [Nocardioides sp.]